MAKNALYAAALRCFLETAKNGAIFWHFWILPNSWRGSRSLENLKNSLDLAMRACGACVWYMDVKTYGFEVISGPDDILPFNNLEDFFDAIVPEARANTRSVLEEILSGKVDRKVLILDYSDSEDGELRIMEISMAGVLKYGNIVGVVGTFKELSAGIS